MPKQVDHQERRELLADALMRVAATQGLGAISLRHVAAEAGVTAGMVQHYFATKDELMTFALDAVSRCVQARLARIDLGPAPRPRELVGALLFELLPLDETRRREAHVALAFHAYAAVKPEVAEGLRTTTAQMREFLAGQVRAAQDAGESPVAIDPAAAATALLSLVEGLALHVLARHHGADSAAAALDAHLDVVLGPRAGPSHR